MVHIVQPGETLSAIARRFGTTVPALCAANVICNPNRIFPGQALVIPQPGRDLPRAGAGPYYVMQPGDTLWCLSQTLGVPLDLLMANNPISDPHRIRAGTELLVIPERPDPVELHTAWAEAAGVPCPALPGFTVHGLYYRGTFLWEALGEKATPFLVDLLRHPCDTVRLYAAISLGRIARGSQVQAALQKTSEDADPSVRHIAGLALRRLRLAARWGKRIHIITTPTELLLEPHQEAAAIPLAPGTEVIGIRWLIPSPTGEEGPRGGLQLYDQVQVVRTEQPGFLPRAGQGELTFI